MTDTTTHMLREILEIPSATRRLLKISGGSIAAAAEHLRRSDPAVITTIARGSSDHAAYYLKYAIELVSGVPVASTGPSISSIYGARLKLGRAATVSISQSGKSPDIVWMAQAAKDAGALTISLTNVAGSPLAAASANAIDICAGPEKSVAATKTFVLSIVAGLLLLARWRRDDKLLTAIERLPDQFAAAAGCDWMPLSDRVHDLNSLYVLGRGPSMAIAHEVALKFKETCQIHAEAYSAAEVMHGPVSIVGSGFPVLALAARDAAERSVVETSDALATQGADVFITSLNSGASLPLPFTATGHPLTDPLTLVVSFYAFIEALARRRGLNPDTPPRLKKVTETI